jgi:hypothetical protein
MIVVVVLIVVAIVVVVVVLLVLFVVLTKVLISINSIEVVFIGAFNNGAIFIEFRIGIFGSDIVLNYRPKFRTVLKI